MPSSSHARGMPRSAISTRPACATPSGRTRPSFGSPKVTLRAPEPRARQAPPRRRAAPRAGRARRRARPRGVDGLDRRPDRARRRAAHARARAGRRRRGRRRPARRGGGRTALPVGSGASATPLAGAPERVQVDPRVALDVVGAPHEPNGDAGPTPEQVTGHDEAVSAVVALAADDRDPAASGRAEHALERVDGAAARILHQQEARHAVALRRAAIGPPHLLRRRERDHEPGWSRPVRAFLTARFRPRRGPAPPPGRRRG